MVLDSCLKGNNLIVLRDFNATTGTDIDDYESCVGPHGSGSRDESSLMLLDFDQLHKWGSACTHVHSKIPDMRLTATLVTGLVPKYDYDTERH